MQGSQSAFEVNICQKLLSRIAFKEVVCCVLQYRIILTQKLFKELVNIHQFLSMAPK